jgi:cell division protein FtsL
MNKQIGWKQLKQEKRIEKIVNISLTVFILGIAVCMMLVFINKCLQ